MLIELLKCGIRYLKNCLINIVIKFSLIIYHMLICHRFCMIIINVVFFSTCKWQVTLVNMFWLILVNKLSYLIVCLFVCLLCMFACLFVCLIASLLIRSFDFSIIRSSIRSLLFLNVYNYACLHVCMHTSSLTCMLVYMYITWV